MLVTDKPDDLEARAGVLERKAVTVAAQADRAIAADGKAYALTLARDMQDEARQLRKRAAELRHRRTDGVRFG